MASSRASSPLDDLREAALLEPAQLQELSRSRTSADPRALLGSLVQRRWLTAFQGRLLLEGRAAELRLGPYAILQPVGAGGIGQVFKARDQRTQTLVALKVIRPELLADADVVKRFQREMELARQLDHPHVVHALDAGVSGGTYYLAMEFLEGADLARLVQDGGPLPVAAACAYLRQAALGLQHIYERGLVHRDIKPPNLLLTKPPEGAAVGVLKLLDLGLARLRYKMNRTGKTSLVTVLGDALMIGTPDYLSPEQALDFHAADIRSDIYSLGCTLHFLLCAEPPFPGGSLPHKLLRHQQAAPPDLQQARPEVPAEVARLARQMLAKDARDRPQTPADVAAALTAFTSAGSAPATGIQAGGGRKTRVTLAPAAAPLAATERSPRRRAVWLPLCAGAGLLAAGLVLLVVLLLPGSAAPPSATRLAAGATPAAARPTAPAPGPQLDPAQTVVLVAASSPDWKYLPASAVENLAGRWHAADFNDAAWRSGKAPLGHGSSNETKAIADRNGTTIPEKGISFVFRRAFSVPADLLQRPGMVLRLRVASDNCATVWLNGAVADEEKANRDFRYYNRDVAVLVQLLQPGRNWMTALVTNTKGSSDIFFDVELTTGPRAP